jgi:Sulfotransferase family
VYQPGAESSSLTLQLPAFSPSLTQLRTLREPGPSNFLTQVRSVVLIASSSRSGSSMLAETLRHSTDLLSLSAEMNPFLRMVGLGFPDSGSASDRLDARHLDLLDASAHEVLSGELARDVGYPAAAMSAVEFAANTAWRLAVQWPHLSLDPHMCMNLTLDVIRRIHRGRGCGSAEIPDAEHVFIQLLAVLRRQGMPVSSGLYDLPTSKAGHPSAETTDAALGECLLEEPPFVVPRLWRRADPAEVANKALVIKTPSNVYRFGLLQALFPNARLRVVHLTRNPAAAINGLYDGWRSKWFHSHQMAEPLRIRGYADEFPASARWWKFDLPPGWQEYTDADLLEVCAFQWRSAHQAILGEIASSDVDHLEIRFEDILSSPQCRVKTFRYLGSWLGIPFRGGYQRAAEQGVPTLVTTAKPTPGRWLSRASQIYRVLDPQVLDLTVRLGYENSRAWI